MANKTMDKEAMQHFSIFKSARIMPLNLLWSQNWRILWGEEMKEINNKFSNFNLHVTIDTGGNRRVRWVPKFTQQVLKNWSYKDATTSGLDHKTSSSVFTRIQPPLKKVNPIHHESPSCPANQTCKFSWPSKPNQALQANSCLAAQNRGVKIRLHMEDGFRGSRTRRTEGRSKELFNGLKTTPEIGYSRRSLHKLLNSQTPNNRLNFLWLWALILQKWTFRTGCMGRWPNWISTQKGRSNPGFSFGQLRGGEIRSRSLLCGRGFRKYRITFEISELEEEEDLEDISQEKAT